MTQRKIKMFKFYLASRTNDKNIFCWRSRKIKIKFVIWQNKAVSKLKTKLIHVVLIDMATKGFLAKGSVKNVPIR